MEPVFGLHAVEALLRESPAAIAHLYVQAGRKDKRMRGITELAASRGVEVTALPRQELDMKTTGRHQGAVAEMKSAGTKGDGGEGGRAWNEARLREHLDSLSRPALLLVLDGIEDPRNLGACLRSADATGADAVIIPRSHSPGLTPAVRKVACGAAETVPLIPVANLARTLGDLKERGIWLFGAAADAPDSIYASDLTGPLALVLGAEDAGLRRLTREACDYLISLPMQGSVPSLNVSVAAGICLYEALRQRQGQAGQD